jgi:hypothetical protein
MSTPTEVIDVQGTVGTTSVQPTFVQRAGLYLAGGVGALIAIVTVCLVIFLWRNYPSMPAETTLATPEAASAALERFKALSDVTMKNSTEMFQTVVTQALLPVFTAILGYIFGRGAKDTEV